MNKDMCSSRALIQRYFLWLWLISGSRYTSRKPTISLFTVLTDLIFTDKSFSAPLDADRPTSQKHRPLNTSDASR